MSCPISFTLRRWTERSLDRTPQWCKNQRSNPSTQAGAFSSPVDGNLYDLAELDAWLARYVASLRERVASGESASMSPRADSRSPQKWPIALICSLVPMS